VVRIHLRSRDWSAVRDDDELIARADHTLLRGIPRAGAERRQGGEAFDRDGTLFIKTGVPISRFNAAFITRPLADPAAAIADAIAYFDALKLPFIVRLRQGVDVAAERAAESQGLPYRDTVPGMVLPRIGVIPDSPKELEISAVHDAATLDDHLQVLVASFGMPMDLARRLLTLHTVSAGAVPGYVDGEPVASSALIATDGTAGVWNVGCLPSHRRRASAKR
jgi:hypothetical protein